MLASSLSSNAADLGSGHAAHAAGLGRRRDRVTIAAPPIEAAEQFLGPKTEASELVRALGRGIAANPVAIDHINLRGIEACGHVGGHLAIGKAERSGNVTGSIGLARARVDDGDGTAASLEIERQIPGI